jgi:hypothetical protein
MIVNRSLSSLLVCIGALLCAACSHYIGDPCNTNVDCSPLGDRFCDTAPLNGYCTKEDCGPTTCPSEAVCIRFFATVESESCNTSVEHIPFSQADCPNIDDRCVCDESVPDNTQPSGVSCVSNAGHCAPSSTERHWCMRSCSTDSDCRQGYECRSTGTFGAEPLPTFNNGYGTPAKFCAPKPTT